MTNGEVFTDYDILAAHYDSVYYAARGNRLGEIALVHEILSTYKPDAESLLDLGTGTGAILASFKGVISELVGIDISPEMLAVARQKLPEAEFVQADMADFKLDKEFDAAICIFDAINHLPSFDQWESFFRKTNEHLKPGGIFVFDMVTSGLVRRLSSYREPDYWPIEGGHYALQIESRDPNHYTAGFTVEFDGNDGVTQTVTGKIHEVVFPIEEVIAAANEHFELRLAFDAKHDILNTGLLEPVSNGSNRPMFVYEKRPDSDNAFAS